LTGGVARHFAGAIALGVATLFVVSVVTFLATNVVPTDTARIALGRSATEEQLQQFREQQHLDEPVVERYGSWLAGFLTGDWGTSAVNRREVADEVLPRLGRTVIIGTAAMAIAIPLAFLIGVHTGQRSGRRLDLGVSIGTLFLNSLPEFVIGLSLLMLLGVKLGLLPVESSAILLGEGWQKVEAYILPILTLVFVMTPYLTRMVRVNVRDVVGQPFVRSAVLRGVPRGLVTRRHVVPNATLPVISVIALSMAELIGGIVVVETLFGFPGVGELLVESVLASDIPVVQAIALIVAFGYVALNLLADAALVSMNPRLRTS
jgi:peptide/nickel transport system permease protein